MLTASFPLPPPLCAAGPGGEVTHTIYWQIDIVFLIVAVLFPAGLLLYIRARALERFRREDYLLGLQRAHTRDTSLSLVR